MRNPLTLDTFAEWAAKMPADREYDYWDCDACAGAQYTATLGLDYGEMLRNHVPIVRVIDGFCQPPNTTFGALATRLRDASRGRAQLEDMA